MIVSPRPAVPSTLMPLPSRSTSAGPPVVLALHCSQVPSCLRLRRKQDPIVFALMVALHVVQANNQIPQYGVARDPLFVAPVLWAFGLDSQKSCKAWIHRIPVSLEQCYETWLFGVP